MNRLLFWISILLFALIVVAALRSVFQKQWWFLRETDKAKEAYVVLGVAAAALFTWAYFGAKLQIKSLAGCGKMDTAT